VTYVRTVKTSSGATAVQVVWSSGRGSRSIEHLGSGHDEAALAALKAAAVQRLAAGQAELDLGVAVRSGSKPLPITSLGRRICGKRCAAHTRCSGSTRPLAGRLCGDGMAEPHRAARRLGRPVVGVREAHTSRWCLPQDRRALF
jgi:hypothetical protein